MANTPRFSNVAANAAGDAVGPLLDSGLFRIYDGTQPATADTAVDAQVQLAELVFNATAFGAANNGTITAGAIASDGTADATGTAAWFRAVRSDGGTVIFDGSVGTSGCDLNLNAVEFQAGATVAVSAFTVAWPKQA